ncbi:hypothetical protein AVEN_201866-1 [Araneus ventricosus]|uniref:PiggyBac transposable element-derived protein domain-containing protein n=1 Tax=Araneus ventricosus TaxID=182803 RepID=A0A4Y2KNE3_ARAVE|nr:hypothetical protein AVEN_201866-1 [Araneus ventricosus]
MIPFTERCRLRQYVPNKPNPLALKNFVLSARGLVIDFIIYDGKGCVSPEDKRNYVLGGGMVKRLSAIPQDATHVLCTDRYFTGIKFAEYLLDNIYMVGTINNNRLSNAQNKLKPEKDLNRGEWDEVVRSDEKMCIVKWKDNKSVTLLSTCIGSEPVTTCKRWSKQEKKKIDVPQPAVIKAYNASMGGWLVGVGFYGAKAIFGHAAPNT